MAGPPSPVCLVCHKVIGTENILDQLPPTMNLGSGWAIVQYQLLVECPHCHTVRLYFEQRVRVDQGDYEKRSLR